jgi:putative oxidoreductase
MKIAANIVGTLLGLAFVLFSSLFFLGAMPAPPPGTPKIVLDFMAVFAPSGWLAFVKGCELAGGILVAVPKTRNFGLLVLGPIIINIVVFHALVAQGGVFPIPFVLGLLALFLLWVDRKKFLGLLN